MTLKISNDFQPLQDHLEAWRQLVETTPGQPFFMLPAYQQAWWEHLGHGELQLYSFWEAKELVGLAPLYVDAVDGQLVARLVGAMDESDYLDILARPEFLPNILEKLLEELANNSISAVWLESIPEKSETYKTLLNASKNIKDWQPKRTEQTVSPVITLPQSYAEYLASLPSKQAKTFKRLMVNLEEEDEISYRTVTQVPEVSEAISTFIKLHKASGTEKASFWNPAREAFFTTAATELAKEGLVQLAFLDVNGQPAATMLIFEWQNQWLLYNSGFDAYQFGHLGVSNALVLRTIQMAIEKGLSRYDFMRGGESYKFIFGAVAEPVWDIKVARK